MGRNSLSSSFLILLLALLFVQTASARKKVPFQVCEQSETWTRPSEEVQAEMWNDPRYWGFGSQSEQWTRNFFVDYGGVSPGYHMKNLTGMWTALDVGHPRDCEELWRQVNIGKGVEIWVLLHRIKESTT